MSRHCCLVFSIFCYLFIFGCARPIKDEVSQAHINIEPDGFVVKDDERHFEYKCERQEHILSELNKIDAYVKQNRNEPLHLMFFVHGGLVSIQGALTNINTLVENNKIKGTNIYPVFINWDSRLWSSLYDDIFIVRRGVRAPMQGTLTSPFIFLSRLVDSVIRGVPNVINQADSEKKFIDDYEREEINHHGGYMTKQAAISTVSLPISVVAVPALSGFGEGAWNMMKRRIDQMFAHEISPLKTEGQEQIEESGGLRIFLREFRNKFQKDILDGKIKVDLVGHSMGAIVITRLLREFPDIPFNRIIYLAPANSIEDFKMTIPFYLAQHQQARFYSYSLSVQDETQEFNYFTPKGSLLVWIDNMLETNLSAEDRRVGSFVNKSAFRVDCNFRYVGDESCKFDKESSAKKKNINTSICRRMRFVKFTGETGPNNAENKKFPYSHGSFDKNRILQRQLGLSTFYEQLAEEEFVMPDKKYFLKEYEFYNEKCGLHNPDDGQYGKCAAYLPCYGYLHKKVKEINKPAANTN